MQVLAGLTVRTEVIVAGQNGRRRHSVEPLRQPGAESVACRPLEATATARAAAPG